MQPTYAQTYQQRAQGTVPPARPAAPQTPPTPQKPGGNGKTIAIIVLSLLIIAGLIGGLLWAFHEELFGGKEETSATRDTEEDSTKDTDAPTETTEATEAPTEATEAPTQPQAITPAKFQLNDLDLYMDSRFTVKRQASDLLELVSDEISVGVTQTSVSELLADAQLDLDPAKVTEEDLLDLMAEDMKKDGINPLRRDTAKTKLLMGTENGETALLAIKLHSGNCWAVVYICKEADFPMLEHRMAGYADRMKFSTPDVPPQPAEKNQLVNIGNVSMELGPKFKLQEGMSQDNLTVYLADYSAASFCRFSPADAAMAAGLELPAKVDQKAYTELMAAFLAKQGFNATWKQDGNLSYAVYEKNGYEYLLSPYYNEADGSGWFVECTFNGGTRDKYQAEMLGYLHTFKFN